MDHRGGPGAGLQRGPAIGCLDDLGGGGDESPAAGATAAGPGPAGERTGAGEAAGH